MSSPISASSPASDNQSPSGDGSPASNNQGPSNDARFSPLLFESKARADSATPKPSSEDNRGPLYYDFNPLATETNKIKLISMDQAVAAKGNEEEDDEDDFVLVR